VKERLTGALILVALIVLLVPELLSGPIRSAPRTHAAAAAAAAAAEEPPLRSYTINLAEDAHARSSAHTTAADLPGPVPPAAPPAASAAGGSAAVDGPAATQSERQGRAPAAAAATAAATGTTAATATHSGGAVAAGAGAPAATSGTSGAWMVQLGSFASRDNAERLAKQLRGGGLQVSVSQGATGRRLYRVRAGPVPDHAAAEQLAGKLRAQGHPGEIVPK
jgi:DedD protein